MTRLWFKAKRYGWGWTPVSIEGWIVLAIFVALVAAGVVAFITRRHAGADPIRADLLFALWIALLVGGLIATCAAKGEKPGWRWGK